MCIRDSPEPAPGADPVYRQGAEQLLYRLHQICQGSGGGARPVDQPAERGGDHPAAKAAERRHPAGQLSLIHI